MRGLPTVAKGFDWCELDGLGLNGGVGFGDDDCLAGDARDFFGGDDGRRGEAPGSVDDDADAEAEAGVFGDIWYGEGLGGAAFGREAEADALVADADDADVGVGGFELFGF